MAYKEPGVNVKQQNNPKYNVGVTPSLINVIVGTCLTTLETTLEVVKSSQSYDVLPIETITQIISVGDLKTSVNYTPAVDYALDEIDKTHINWLTGTGQEKSPAVGSTYYVTVKYTVGDNHYKPVLIADIDKVEETYGPDVDSEGNINRVALGAKINLESGSNLIYVLPVKVSGETVTADDYNNAYEKYLKFLPDAYRIIPMDLDLDINLKTINHVNLMSNPEEKGERVTLLGAVHDSTDASSVITNVGGYADSLKNKRVIIPYPDKVERVLSDSNSYELDAPFICSALAGLKASLPVSQAYTKSQLLAFTELKGVDMFRSEKNMLASKGVLILEQPAGYGTPIDIRHGLTTDMSNVQTKEASIIEIGDYTAKYLRNGLKKYIGKYNITADFLTRLKASTNTLLAVLRKDNIILDGSRIMALYQDEENPDTIVMKVLAKVPYPCNYIEITLFLD